MKRTILLLTAVLCLAVNGICSPEKIENNVPSVNPPTGHFEEIDIERLGGSGLEGNRPRSARKPVAAYINHEDGVIAVCFNLIFGEVTVSVENSLGEIVSSYICDTASEEVIYIDAPEAAGDYTLNIDGTDLSASGTFSIL